MRDRAMAAAWLLAAAIVGLYLPALDGQLLDWDDGVWLGDPILQLGLLGALEGAFGSTLDRAWYPVLRMSWWLQTQVTGQSAAAMHAVNLALFAGTIPPLVALLQRCGVRVVPALLGVTLWATHPTRVESVAWITSRKDVLALALLVGAAHCMLPSNGRSRRVVLGTVLCSAAVATKVAVAPLTMVLALAVRADSDSRTAARVAGPSVLVALLVGLVGLGVFQGGVVARPYDGWVDNGAFALWQLGSWTSRLFQLTGLAAVHPLPESPWPGAAVGAVALLALSAFTWTRRRDPWALTWCGWVALPLLPVCGVVSMAHWAADRHLLYPSLALAVGGAVLVDRALASRGALRIAPALLALPLAWGTSVRIPDWNNPIALWEADRSRPGTHWVRGVQLGTAYGRAGRFQEAVEAYRGAERLNPDSDLILARRIIAELAADGWSQADGRAAQVLQPEPSDASGWSTAATLLMDTGNLPAARDAAERALARGSDDFRTHLVLAAVAVALGDRSPEPHLEAAARHSQATVDQLRQQVRAFLWR